MGQPQVQAGYMKRFVAQVDRLAERGQSIRAADPELFREIEKAGAMSWLPVELNVRLVDVLVQELGPKRASEFQCDQLTSQFSAPLWRGFVEGEIRTHEKDPAAMARWIPGGMSLIFSDCGEWTVEDLTDTSAAVHLSGLPSVLSGSPGWLDSMAGGMCALFSVCQTTGEARVTDVDRDLGRARIELHWKAVVE